MTTDTLAAALFWCAGINYAVLLAWFLLFSRGHDWLYRLHGRWFRLPVEQFDALHYAGMSLLKLGILLFNLTPAVALRLVGG